MVPERHPLPEKFSNMNGWKGVFISIRITLLVTFLETGIPQMQFFKAAQYATLKREECLENEGKFTTLLKTLDKLVCQVFFYGYICKRLCIICKDTKNKQDFRIVIIRIL